MGFSIFFMTVCCSIFCKIAVGSSIPEFSDVIKNQTIDAFHQLDGIKIDTGTKFYLFTNADKNGSWILKTEDSRNLEESPLNPEWMTKILIHGWTDSAEASWLKTFRNNYFNAGNYNIIFVDWSKSSRMEYLISATLTRQVGRRVGELLENLEKFGNLSLSRVHILGHSLGAHVAGFAGSYLSGRVARITGMDPACPGFEFPLITTSPDDRLDPTDAEFVDVIHTCAGIFGFVSPIGDADFYPNGGICSQPGCPLLTTQSCSHSRSHELMAESVVLPDEFIALKCDSWKKFLSGSCESDGEFAFMGENVSQDVRGKFYLATNTRQPFGRNN